MDDNQPTLKQAIADAFDDTDSSPRERRLAAAERQAVTTAGKGHGRAETRTLTSTTALCGGAAGGDPYLDWPGARQVFKVERSRTTHGGGGGGGGGGGKVQTQTSYGVTSLTRGEADAARLLALNRGHWSIENGLHYVRDVTMGEDACRVRAGPAPQALACLRNAAVTLLNRAGHENKAAALRRHAAHPDEALAMIRDTS